MINECKNCNYYPGIVNDGPDLPSSESPRIISVVDLIKNFKQDIMSDCPSWDCCPGHCSSFDCCPGHCGGW